MSDDVRVHKTVMEAMLAEARREPEMERCGLLAGRDGVISVILPAPNALHSATSYEIAPKELFALFRRMRAQRLDHLGIYHSHPRGENAPSPRDLERAFYPGAAYFIVSPLAGALRPVRAFRIGDARANEIRLDV